MTALRFGSATVAAFALASAGFAQTQLPFPARVRPLALPGLDGVLDLQPDPTALAELTDLSAVVLTDVPLPGGRRVDLRLDRRAFDPRAAGVFVDGIPAEYDPGDLTLWEGSIVGMPGSGVSLSLSSVGSYGWIDDGIEHVNVTSFPSAQHGWSRAGIRMFTEAAHLAAGDAFGPATCEADSLPSGPGTPGNTNPDQVPNPSWNGVTLECRMAVETDFQLYQNWGNLAAEQAYVFNLLGAVSDRYLTQIDTRLTFPYVQFYTNSNDPWTSQDTGGSSGDLLNEFRAAWAGNIPTGAHLGHFLSGAGLGGGVAWLGVLCNNQNGFAVSGNINGGTTFPVQQGSNTWDFMVTAHETGHNFGTPHTHDYCPPLDQCANNCTGSIVCTNQGTVMSYCHGCSGGMSNITTFFHPTVVNTMRNGAEASCIPNDNSSAPTVLFTDGFESGGLAAGGWAHGNLPGQVVTAASKEGTYGCRIRNKRWIEKAIDTTGYSTVTLEVWRRTKNYESNENLRIRMHDGNSWTTIEDTNNPGWGRIRVDLPASAGNNPNLVIRFKSKGSQGNERGDIDAVVISGR